MREIKFRAWDIRLKRYLPKNITDNFTFKQLEENPMFIFEQYTGLKDKNGVEIYEGDIVKVRHYNRIINELEAPEICEVKYTERAAFLLQSKLWQWSGFDETKASEYEVIGNIHENPELLK